MGFYLQKGDRPRQMRAGAELKSEDGDGAVAGAGAVAMVVVVVVETTHMVIEDGAEAARDVAAVVT